MASKEELHRLIDQLPEGETEHVFAVLAPLVRAGRASVLRGSREALLAVLDAPPLCTTEDVDVLLEVIREGKRPGREEGIFDQDETAR